MKREEKLFAAKEAAESELFEVRKEIEKLNNRATRLQHAIDYFRDEWVAEEFKGVQRDYAKRRATRK